MGAPFFSGQFVAAGIAVVLNGQGNFIRPGAQGVQVQLSRRPRVTHHRQPKRPPALAERNPDRAVHSDQRAQASEPSPRR